MSSDEEVSQDHGQEELTEDADQIKDPGERELTAEEETEMRYMFEDVDQDKDAKITVEQFVIAWRGLGGNPTSADIESSLREMEKDEDDLISYDEFKQFYVRTPQKLPEEWKQELTEAFEYFDKDNDGLLRPEEILTVLRDRGDRLSADELEEMFGLVTKDGDGKLSIEELADRIFEN